MKLCFRHAKKLQCFFEGTELRKSEVPLVPTPSAVGLVTYFYKGKTRRTNLLALLHGGIYVCLAVNWRLSHQGSPITNRINP